MSFNMNCQLENKFVLKRGGVIDDRFYLYCNVNTAN
jgi:hypothetical protein